MSFPAYPEYKDSGVQWLGRIPDHWMIDRMKWSVQTSHNGVWGEEPDGGADDIRCVRVADFDRAALRITDNDVTYRKVSPRDVAIRRLDDGDLVLEKSGGGEKSPVGFLVLYDRSESAITSNFMARIVLKQGMDSRFWTFAHANLYRSRLTQRSIKQTSGIQNLDQQSYFNERVCYPPSAEQSAIADFLDRETAKIDALISKQEQLIATLREDRIATITHAVTKGLDPNAEMKDSGVEWLGEIPQGWEASRLKFVVKSVDSGTSVNAGDWSPADDEIGVLKTSCVSAGRFNAAGSKTVVDPEEVRRVTCPVRGGSLIVNRANTPHLVGSTGYVADDYPNLYLSDKLWQVRFDRASAEFVYFWSQTQAYRSQIAAKCVGASSSMQNLSMGDFRDLSFGLPPITEQHSIADFLEAHCARLDAVISRSQLMIETLREYRSALITDAVTGKIDVRGVA